MKHLKYNHLALGTILYFSSLIALSTEDIFIRDHRVDEKLASLLDEHSNEVGSNLKKSFASFSKKKAWSMAI